jgi:hypothetical protein
MRKDEIARFALAQTDTLRDGRLALAKQHRRPRNVRRAAKSMRGSIRT